MRNYLKVQGHWNQRPQSKKPAHARWEKNANTSSSLGLRVSWQVSSEAWQLDTLIHSNPAPKELNRSHSVTWELHEGEHNVVACTTFVAVGVGLGDIKNYRRVRDKLINTRRQWLWNSYADRSWNDYVLSFGAAAVLPPFFEIVSGSRIGP